MTESFVLGSSCGTGITPARLVRAFVPCGTAREPSASTREGKSSLSAVPRAAGVQGGNIEYAPAEMKKNGATAIHLATGMIVGYPPCTRVDFFRRYIPEQFGIPVVVGTHPIPQKYFKIHDVPGSWKSPLWQELIRPTLATEDMRLAYD